MSPCLGPPGQAPLRLAALTTMMTMMTMMTILTMLTILTAEHVRIQCPTSTT
jgi:hypothetical protein